MLYPDDIKTCRVVIEAMGQQRARAHERADDLEIQLASAVAEIEALGKQVDVLQQTLDDIEPEPEPTNPEGSDAFL